MKRNTKISCDVSREADNMLKAYCLKHERSKGFLLERMIRRYCAEVEINLPVAKVPSVDVVVKKNSVKRFAKPYLIDVDNYMVERGCLDPVTQAEKFCDFYESNGWKVGKNKMKCWKAAVRNWLKGNGNGQNNTNVKGTGQKKSAVERVNERNNAKYGQPRECGLGMGSDGGHMGGAVDKGEGGATIEYVDNEPFVDY